LSRQIRIEFEKGGVVTARLLENEAPKSCKLIWDALPVQANVLHAMLNGEEVFLDTFPMPHEFPPENEHAYVQPGDLGAAAPANHRVNGKCTLPEGCIGFCLFYGAARPHKAVDQTMDTNLIGKINEIETLRTIGKRIRVHGTERVKITRIE